MTYRLAQQYPVLALPLSSLDPERQVVVARAAAEVAVEASGVSIPTTEARALTALVEALDKVAWGLQDEGMSGIRRPSPRRGRPTRSCSPSKVSPQRRSTRRWLPCAMTRRSWRSLRLGSAPRSVGADL